MARSGASPGRARIGLTRCQTSSQRPSGSLRIASHRGRHWCSTPRAPARRSPAPLWPGARTSLPSRSSRSRYPTWCASTGSPAVRSGMANSATPKTLPNSARSTRIRRTTSCSVTRVTHRRSSRRVTGTRRRSRRTHTSSPQCWSATNSVAIGPYCCACRGAPATRWGQQSIQPSKPGRRSSPSRVTIYLATRCHGAVHRRPRTP